MVAIISELDPVSSATVQVLWQRLRDTCGLTAIYDIPIPHFTWFLADEMEIEKAVSILSQIAARSDPLSIYTSGIGIFSGERPVIYLPIIKTVGLIELHRQIWDQVYAFSKEIKLYYSPTLWVPHITLAVKDLTKENLHCAVDQLTFEPFELIIAVDSLVIGEILESGQVNVLDKLSLEGSLDE